MRHAGVAGSAVVGRGARAALAGSIADNKISSHKTVPLMGMEAGSGTADSDLALVAAVLAHTDRGVSKTECQGSCGRQADRLANAVAAVVAIETVVTVAIVEAGHAVGAARHAVSSLGVEARIAMMAPDQVT